MMLKLHESKLFTVDTAIRFGKEYQVSPRIWNEIWKRYLFEYDIESLCGYFMYKTDKKIRPTALKRWLKLTEIYCRANHVMLMGVRVVSSEYFGTYEEFVLFEVLRNMKYSKTQESRILV